MDYTVYMSDEGMKKGKLGAYKNHIIKNIEKIGQKKLVIIGGGEDYNVLMQALGQLRAKNVKVPDIAFRATVCQDAVSEQDDIRFIDELKGKSASFYVLIIAPYTPLEIQLAGMAGVPETSAAVAGALRAQYGYTENGYCELNEPSGLGMTLAGMKLNKALGSREARRRPGERHSPADGFLQG